MTILEEGNIHTFDGRSGGGGVHKFAKYGKEMQLSNIIYLIQSFRTAIATLAVRSATDGEISTDIAHARLASPQTLIVTAFTLIVTHVTLGADLLAVLAIPAQMALLLQVVSVDLVWRLVARNNTCARPFAHEAVVPGANGAFVFRLNTSNEMVSLLIRDQVPVYRIDETERGVFIDSNLSVHDVRKGVQGHLLQTGHLEYHERVLEEQLLAANYR